MWMRAPFVLITFLQLCKTLLHTALMLFGCRVAAHWIHLRQAQLESTSTRVLAATCLGPCCVVLLLSVPLLTVVVLTLVPSIPVVARLV